MNNLDPGILQAILKTQHNEITEHHIYKKLSRVIKNKENSEILAHIAADEKKHYEFWRGFTKKDLKPRRLSVFKYVWLGRIFGLTFALKLMEHGEKLAQDNYAEIAKNIPETEKIIADESRHEKNLLNMLNEEKLKYVGSIVLGLNDALVELTGALAGLTFAFQKTHLIAIAGLITGIAASFSMAASEYLSTKTETGDDRHPIKASVYTGIAYIFTVIFLIFPYGIFENVYYALGLTLANAVIVIFVFTFYVSVAQDESFKKNFSEMAGISLGVAGLTFIIGIIIRSVWNIEI